MEVPVSSIINTKSVVANVFSILIFPFSFFSFFSSLSLSIPLYIYIYYALSF